MQFLLQYCILISKLESLKYVSSQLADDRGFVNTSVILFILNQFHHSTVKHIPKIKTTQFTGKFIIFRAFCLIQNFPKTMFVCMLLTALSDVSYLRGETLSFPSSQITLQSVLNF